MTDRELLELAAEAAGYAFAWVNDQHLLLNSGEYWNPLADDGDALRLAVKLRLDVLFDGLDSPNAHVEVVANEPGAETQCWAAESMKADPHAATRRAIVRAAAKIGRQMP